MIEISRPYLEVKNSQRKTTSCRRNKSRSWGIYRSTSYFSLFLWHCSTVIVTSWQSTAMAPFTCIRVTRTITNHISFHSTGRISLSGRSHLEIPAKYPYLRYPSICCLKLLPVRANRRHKNNHFFRLITDGSTYSRACSFGAWKGIYIERVMPKVVRR